MAAEAKMPRMVVEKAAGGVLEVLVLRGASLRVRLLPPPLLPPPL